jgi:hypothetical protein
VLGLVKPCDFAELGVYKVLHFCAIEWSWAAASTSSPCLSSPCGPSHPLAKPLSRSGSFTCCCYVENEAVLGVQLNCCALCLH